MIDRWARTRQQLAASASESGGSMPDDSRAVGPIEAGLVAFEDALCEDLNLARATAAVNEATSALDPDACPCREIGALLAMDSVLGVLGRNTAIQSRSMDDIGFVTRVESLISRRAAARAAKDWAASDRIREELAAMGISVVDSPEGPSWRRVARSGDLA